MTAAMLAARRGRPSVDGLRDSLAGARAANVRLIESNTNLALELRARRAEGVSFAREVAASASFLAQPIHAEDTFTVVRVAEAIAAAARRHLSQLGSVIL